MLIFLAGKCRIDYGSVMTTKIRVYIGVQLRQSYVTEQFLQSLKNVLTSTVQR